MTLKELIESLQQLVENGEATGEELVIFAHQPHYPIQCGVGGPVVLGDNEEADILKSYLEFPIGEYFEDQAEWDEAKRDLDKLLASPKFVYLHETWLPYDMSPYAPKSAWGVED